MLSSFIIIFCVFFNRKRSKKVFCLHLLYVNTIPDLDYAVNAPAEVKDNFDLVVDCSGSGPAMQAAVPLLKKGGRLCIFGVANPAATFVVHPFEVRGCVHK